MTPYGSRLTANDFDHSDRPVRVVISKRARAAGRRECSVSADENPSFWAMRREVDAMPPAGSEI